MVDCVLSENGSLRSMKNLVSILDGDLADERTTLAATSCDIERAAAYCRDNYLKVPHEGSLENTMAFATQSLGTVAFHISKLASQFLDTIGLQSEMLGDISDRIDKIRMVCNIHQEKVARKAIGSCTTTKVPINFQHEGLRPEPPQKYIRHPIDFSILDHIGHGSHVQDPPMNQYSVPMFAVSTIERRGSSSASMTSQNPFGRQSSTASCRTLGPKNNLEYATPSLHSTNSLRYQSGTMGRTAGIYRTTVLPPQHMLGSLGPCSNFQYSAESGGSLAGGSVSSNNSAVVDNTTTEGPVTVTTLINPSTRASHSSGMVSNLQGAYHGQYNPGQQVHQLYAQQQQQQQQFRPSYSHLPQNAHTAGAQLIQIRTGLPEGGTSSMMQLRPQKHYLSAQPLQSVTANGQSTWGPAHISPQLLQQNALGAQQQQQEQAQQRHSQQINQPTRMVAGHSMQMVVDERMSGIPNNSDCTQLDDRNTHNSPIIDGNTIIPMGPAVHTSPLSDNSDNITVPPPEAYGEGITYSSDYCSSQQKMQPSIQEQQLSSIPYPTMAACEDNNGLIARKPDDPAWVPDYYIEKVITMYEYVRDKDDELTFTENQMIYVIKKNDDGWWEGIMNGITGLFPGNYVELIE